ncbi:MAG: aspartate dehydrogenase [Candidatus Omnitrophica bacterium]|nr:aspartate dehydrogenase [Candidatus Omnitrophota bacterium]MCM8799518.1 aspartate dehydrogenase [Candidatus Omnitrophota bacterium]
MRKELKIGIVGCGAIGSSLAKVIKEDFSKQAQLVSFYDKDLNRAFSLANNLLGKKGKVSLNLEDLLTKVDLVIEATSVDCSFEITSRSLSFGKDIMVMSVGGILDRFLELKNLAEEKKAKLLIPSGAISGIDAAKAHNLGKIKSIVLTSIKAPSAFKGNLYLLKKRVNLDQLQQDTLLFEGTVEEAIKFFPQNINVSATLSLATLGSVEPKVRIIASPKTSSNIHQIEIVSEAGVLLSRTENIPHPENPKTSYLAVLSAVATLKDYFSVVKVGT